MLIAAQGAAVLSSWGKGLGGGSRDGGVTPGWRGSVEELEVERALGTLDATHKVPRNPGLPREEP